MDFKVAIRALADSIPGLQRQGYHLLHSVKVDLDWRIEEHDCPAIDELDPGSTTELLEETSRDAGYLNLAELRIFAQSLAKEVNSKTPQAETALQRHVGVPQFVDGTFTVICALPKLRVPTNGYLFEIAMTIYLDECKKRGRQKRGGSGVKAAEDVLELGSGDSITHPIERLSMEFQGSFEGDDSGGAGFSAPPNDHSTRAFAVPSTDPTRQYEDKEFLEKFYAYLRRPVDEATTAYVQAQVTGRASAERRKLESLSSKLARTLSVLTMIGEGYTQEQTAERLNLSRNQVKYIIELVQEAYARFSTAFDRSSTRVPRVGDQSDVR